MEADESTAPISGEEADRELQQRLSMEAIVSFHTDAIKKTDEKVECLDQHGAGKE